MGACVCSHAGGDPVCEAHPDKPPPQHTSPKAGPVRRRRDRERDGKSMRTLSKVMSTTSVHSTTGTQNSSSTMSQPVPSEPAPPPQPPLPAPPPKTNGKWTYVLDLFPSEGGPANQADEGGFAGHPLGAMSMCGDVNGGLVTRLGPPRRGSLAGSLNGSPFAKRGGDRLASSGRRGGGGGGDDGASDPMNSSVKSRVDGAALGGPSMEAVERDVSHLAILYESSLYYTLLAAGGSTGHVSSSRQMSDLTIFGMAKAGDPNANSDGVMSGGNGNDNANPLHTGGGGAAPLHPHPPGGAIYLNGQPPGAGGCDGAPPTVTLTMNTIQYVLGTDSQGVLDFAKGLHKALTRVLKYVSTYAQLRGVGRADAVGITDIEAAISAVVGRLGSGYDGAYVHVGVHLLARLVDALVASNDPPHGSANALNRAPPRPNSMIKLPIDDNSPTGVGARARKRSSRVAAAQAAIVVTESQFHLQPLTPLLTLIRESIANPSIGNGDTAAPDSDMNRLAAVLKLLGLIAGDTPDGNMLTGYPCLSSLPLQLFPGEAKGHVLYLSCVADMKNVTLVGIRRHVALEDTTVQVEPLLGFNISKILQHGIPAEMGKGQPFVRLCPMFLDKHGHLERGTGHGMRKELFELLSSMLSSEHLPEEHITTATAILQKNAASAVLAVKSYSNLGAVSGEDVNPALGSSYDDSFGVRDLPLWSKVVFLGTVDSDGRVAQKRKPPPPKPKPEPVPFPPPSRWGNGSETTSASESMMMSPRDNARGVYAAVAAAAMDGGDTRHEDSHGPEGCFSAEILHVECVHSMQITELLQQQLDESQKASSSSAPNPLSDRNTLASSPRTRDPSLPPTPSCVTNVSPSLNMSMLNQTLRTLAALNASLRTNLKTQTFKLQLHRPCPVDTIAMGLVLQRKHVPLFSAQSQRECWFHVAHQEAGGDEPTDPYILRQHFMAGWVLGQAVANGATLTLGLPAVFFHLLKEWRLGEGCDVSRDVVKQYKGELTDVIRNIFSMSDDEYQEVLAGEDLDSGLARQTYCSLFLKSYLHTYIFYRMEAFVKGFRSTGIHHLPVFASLTPQDLSLVLQGREVDPCKDFYMATEFVLAPSRQFFDRPHNEMFWKLLVSVIDDGLGAEAGSDRVALRKRSFLKFVTGSQLLPAQPRQERLRFDMPPMNPPPSTARDYDRVWSRLPTANTCTNRLDLPNYMECLIFGTGSEWYRETGVKVGSKITNEHRKCAWGQLDDSQQEAILQSLRARFLDAILLAIYETESYDGEPGGSDGDPDPMRHSFVPAEEEMADWL